MPGSPTAGLTLVSACSEQDRRSTQAPREGVGGGGGGEQTFFPAAGFAREEISVPFLSGLPGLPPQAGGLLSRCSGNGS